MATLRERSPGKWEIRVFAGRDENGRPHQVSRTVRGSRRSAAKVAATLMTDTPGPEGKRTVAKLLTLWQELNRDRWSAGSLGRRSVSSLKVEELDRWVLRLRAEGVGAASVHNQMAVLRAALGQLAFRISAATGGRRAALAALRWEDVHGSTLVIGGQIVAHPNTVPHHPPMLVREPTKTREVRTVTLDPGTVKAIDDWRLVHRGLGPWLVTIGDRPPSPDAVTWWWRHAREAAGIDPKWRLHDVRHWRATTSFGARTDVRTVPTRLGHSNPAMTLRVYAHAFAAADASAALGKALDDAQ